VRSTSDDNTSTARIKRILAAMQTLETSLDSDLASIAAEHVSTVIGYIELKSVDRHEREYWIALSALTLPLQEIASGQLKYDLMVIQVEYDPISSEVNASHASLRLTQSFVPRAHQDKCRV